MKQRTSYDEINVKVNLMSVEDLADSKGPKNSSKAMFEEPASLSEVLKRSCDSLDRVSSRSEATSRHVLAMFHRRRPVP